MVPAGAREHVPPLNCSSVAQPRVPPHLSYAPVSAVLESMTGALQSEQLKG